MFKGIGNVPSEVKTTQPGSIFCRIPPSVQCPEWFQVKYFIGRFQKARGYKNNTPQCWTYDRKASWASLTCGVSCSGVVLLEGKPRRADLILKCKPGLKIVLTASWWLSSGCFVHVILSRARIRWMWSSALGFAATVPQLFVIPRSLQKPCCSFCIVLRVTLGKPVSARTYKLGFHPFSPLTILLLRVDIFWFATIRGDEEPDANRWNAARYCLNHDNAWKIHAMVACSGLGGGWMGLVSLASGLLGNCSLDAAVAWRDYIWKRRWSGVVVSAA